MAGVVTMATAQAASPSSSVLDSISLVTDVSFVQLVQRDDGGGGGGAALVHAVAARRHATLLYLQNEVFTLRIVSGCCPNLLTSRLIKDTDPSVFRYSKGKMSDIAFRIKRDGPN